MRFHQLDGFSSDEWIKVIAATNRADILDPALMRSGRLDLKIEFPHPTEEARAWVLQIHSRKMNVNNDVNFEELVRSTEDFNYAQLKGGLCGGQNVGSPARCNSARLFYELNKLTMALPEHIRACLETGKLASLAILVSAGIVLQILACALYDNWWTMTYSQAKNINHNFGSLTIPLPHLLAAMRWFC